MIVKCEECVNLHSDRAKNPKYWMCTKFPRLEIDNFVTTETRVSDPYMYCHNINGGCCCLFERKKL